MAPFYLTISGVSAATVDQLRLGNLASRAILATSGFVRAQRGPGLGGATGKLLPAQIAAVMGTFVHPDGTIFYPGGTSW